MNRRKNSVSIVLATHNGASFLEEQLCSLLAQDHRDWRLILSDDGSKDQTLEIAKRCIPTTQLTVLAGNNAGLALNFWNGLMHVPDGDYAAFCDQDDVWCRKKLTMALTQLEHCEGPALYSAGRYVTDAELNVLDVQPRRPIAGPISTAFRNQAAGHTCVLSPEAVTLLKRFSPSETVPFHDWWTVLVLHAQRASFVHDPRPVLYYRQHKTNAFGAKGGRLKLLLSGRYLGWIAANLRALYRYRIYRIV